MAKVSPPYAGAAVAHLKRVDPVLGAVIDRVGDYSINRRPDRFHSLVQAIIFQQLAGRAAQTIFDRFVAAVGGGRFPTPDRLLAASDETMRSAGLSRGKMAYIRDLATHVNNRTLSFHRHAQMTDDEVIADLTRVRGIGRWTAEMFLMFNLHRPDVLPVDDLGVRNAVARLYGMSAPPPPKELRVFGQRWSPYRTVASWYLWQSLNVVPPDGAAARTPAKPASAKTTKANPAKPPKVDTSAKANPAARKSVSAKPVTEKNSAKTNRGVIGAKPATEKNSAKVNRAVLRAKPATAKSSTVKRATAEAVEAKSATAKTFAKGSPAIARQSASVARQRESVVGKPKTRPTTADAAKPGVSKSGRDQS
jgi:DNA-3-methyladenine glycosylase II